jgi:hypothetical protein
MRTFNQNKRNPNANTIEGKLQMYKQRKVAFLNYPSTILKPDNNAFKKLRGMILILRQYEDL